MKTHTPGPWHTIGALADRPLVEAEDGGMVADLVEREDDAETRANAILIAAAPELLEALRKCLSAFSVSATSLPEDRQAVIEAVRQAHDAIAKAEGKS
jgi:hypothetical protein